MNTPTKQKLIFVVLAGIVFSAALLILGARYVTLVAGILYLLTVLLVVGSVVLATTQRGYRRAIWSGCAVFAMGYFFLAFLEPAFWQIVERIVGVRSSPVSSQVITSFWFAWLYDRVGGPEIWTGGGSRVPAIYLLYATAGQIPRDLDISDLKAFIRTGHCITTWILGAIGAMVGSLFYGLLPATELSSPVSEEQ